MTLKRQYKMEAGRLKYFVDTAVNIEDELLLDILSGATSRHIRQIVSTIQSEQNRAIRYDNARLLSVIGGAGSGKTSVAMHRASYLMYRQREHLDAKHIGIVSPSHSFSEYISTVLPELGEENVASVTLHTILEKILNRRVEHPLAQTEILLDETNGLRRNSVRQKAGAEFLKSLKHFSERYRVQGPDFPTISLGKQILATSEEMTRMYRIDYRLMTPALRLIRIQTILENRIAAWEKSLYAHYEQQLLSQYRGKDLDMATRLAVSHRLQPVRAQIKTFAQVSPTALYAQALAEIPEIADLQNEDEQLIWWEDAAPLAYLMLALGFATPDATIRHLIVDEAQDYSDAALAMMMLYYPSAHVTLLGDPKQRTCPAMPPCDPGRWGACFHLPDAPILTLTRCYRSTLPITRMCNAILPDAEQVVPFGREGMMPKIVSYTDERLKEAVAEFVAEGHKVIAVVTRTLKDAQRVSQFIPHAHLLDGSDEDILTDPEDISVGTYHLMKGLEFDAVVVAWPDARLSDGERRRLYTACSRALHGLALLAPDEFIHKLGIVL